MKATIRSYRRFNVRCDRACIAEPSLADELITRRLKMYWPSSIFACWIISSSAAAQWRVLPNVDCFDLDAATQLEMAVKQVIERDCAGILVAGMVTGNSAQYVLQVKDGAEALRRIVALSEARMPARIQYDREEDPAWRSTFDLLWGRGRAS